MAITTTWSIKDMQRNQSNGGVSVVYWSLDARNQTGTDGLGNPIYGAESASEGGKLRLTPDPDAADFVAYEDLTEATVLGWVWNSLREGDETADEAKSRIEADRTAKVQGQIDRANTEASGMPW